MAQHFLLSAAARTLSLKVIFSEGEEAAYRRFCRLRWPDTDGAPECPVCDCIDVYDLTTRRRFKCAACHRQFSVTWGTIFASRKLAFVDLLGAICLFVNASKGLSAVQLSRDLDVQHKKAFVLMHKLRGDSGGDADCPRKPPPESSCRSHSTASDARASTRPGPAASRPQRTVPRTGRGSASLCRLVQKPGEPALH